MAWTQTDLDRLKKAIASGVLNVEVDGQKIQYRSMADLMQAAAAVERELQSAASAPRVSYAEFDAT